MTSILTSHPTSTSLRHTLGTAAEARAFGAFWGCLLAVDVTRALPAQVQGVGGLALVGLVVAVTSHGQPPAVGLALAATGWLFVTGFVVHADGLLRVSGPADAVRLLALVAAALLSRTTGRNR